MKAEQSRSSQRQRRRYLSGGLPPDKYLTEDQQRKLCRYVTERADAARYRKTTRAVVDEMLVLTLLNTGLRADELCHLQAGDIHAEADKPAVFVRHGKGGTRRTVEVSRKFARKLRDFIRYERPGAKPTDYVFGSERAKAGDNKPYCYYSVYTKVKQMGRAVGIPYLSPHVLRHTYLTRLYNTERDLRFTQDQAGHASPTTTAIYARTDQKARRRQVEALDKLWQ